MEGTVPCICSSIYISQHSDIWILIRHGFDLCIFQISCSLLQKKMVLCKGLAVNRPSPDVLGTTLFSWTDCLTSLCFAFRFVKWGSSSLENTLGCCGNSLGCICFAELQKCNCSSCRLIQTVLRKSDCSPVSTGTLTAQNLVNTNKPYIYKLPDTFCSPAWSQAVTALLVWVNQFK